MRPDTPRSSPHDDRMIDADALTLDLEEPEDAPSGYDWSRLDLARLVEPDVVRRLLGIAVALLVVGWPERSVIILGRLVAIGLIGYALLTLWSLRKERPLPWVGVAPSLLALGVGVLLIVSPSQTEVALGRLLGIGLALAGLLKIVGALRRRGRADFGWSMTSAVSLVGAGILVNRFPTELLSTLTVAVAIAWIVAQFLSISVLLDPDRHVDAPRNVTSDLVAEWFADRPKSVDDRQRLYDEVLFEGDRTQTKTVRFVMLMIFAAVIASMGVVADSTAVVVGAMLIAPLMTPLMGMALSLAMGWPNRLARSSLMVAVGIVIAIGLGFLIGLANFTIVDTATNTQILSRSNPTVIDLVIAVAAGAAGAYALSRPDVSNSLPGVAIAIALVPPLTVVGISYSQGDWDSGSGALLLFATNAIAIMIVGAVVFLLTGVAPLSRATGNQYRVRTALVAVGSAAAVITAVLVLNGTSVATNVFEQQAAADVVSEWIEPYPDYTIVGIDVVGDSVSVVVAGPPTERPSVDELAEGLSAELGRDIAVDLRTRLETQERSGA